MGEVRASLLALIEAEEEVAASIRDHQRYTLEFLADVDGGLTVSEVAYARPPAAHRERVHRAISRFEETRSTSRDVMVQTCMAEGLTVREIAILWGVSKQLVHRHVAAQTKPRTNGD